MIGIGAQKAGTSWLFEYLRGHPDCHIKAVKEVHYFNRIRRGGNARFRELIITERLALQAGFEGTTGSPFKRGRVANLDEFIRKLSWPWTLYFGRFGAYLSYLHSGRGGKKLVGEITPAYAMCTADEFRQIIGLAPDVRLVYLLRDPVERTWSAIRMEARRRVGNDGDAVRISKRLLEEFLDGHAADIADRTDYQKTLNELQASVPREKIYVAFFEELFHKDGVAALTEFLGIRNWPAKLERVVHQGTVVELGQARLGRARKYLDDQYQAVEKYMGRLPETWHKYPKEAA